MKRIGKMYETNRDTEITNAALSLVYLFNGLSTLYSIYLFVQLYGTIYQPLRSGRIWHKVNF